jgi:tetratricopeptide (TPR) repeat protein
MSRLFHGAIRFGSTAALLLATISFSGCSRSPAAKEAIFLKRGDVLAEKKEYSRALLEYRNASAVASKDAEPYYRMGLAYLAMGDGVNAIRAFTQATNLNPKHAGAQLKLAELMTSTPDPNLIGEAVGRLESAFGAEPDDPEAIDTLAIAEWKLGMPEGAVQRLEQALKKFPTNLQTSITLARMRLSKQDWNGAEEVLKAAVKEAPDSSQAALALGELYLYLRRPAPAEEEIQRAIKLDPKNGPALMSLGSIQFAAKRLEEANKTFKQVSALPDQAYRPVHALFLLQSGKQDQALGELEALDKADPSNRGVRSRLVALYFNMNRTADAENVLAAALKRNAKDTDALMQRAELRLRAGKLDLAENDLRQVLHFNPDSGRGHFMLGVTYKAKHLTSSERQELQQAIQFDPALLPARLALEVSYLASNQAKAALDVMDQAPAAQKTQFQWIVGHNWALLASGNLTEARAGIDLLLNAGRPAEAVFQFATLRFQERDYSGARTLVDELLKRDVSDVRVAQLMMDVYMAQKDVPKGIARLKDWVAAHPKSASLQNLLGQWDTRVGDLAGARAAFASALTADDHLTAASLALAEIDLREGKTEAALQRLNLVLAADPKNIRALLLSARAEGAAGARANMIASYRAVLSIDNSNLFALNNLAYELAPENPDEALKFAQQAAELAPESPNVQDTLGWVYYRKGLYTMAARCLKTAVDKEMTPQRQFHLGMAYLKTGDRVNGQKIVLEALQKDPNLAKTEQGW